jgi:hypothetical protein
MTGFALSINIFFLMASETFRTVGRSALRSTEAMLKSNKPVTFDTKKAKAVPLHSMEELVVEEV